MSEQPSNAVFISYRRDVGWTLAMALYQHLIDHDVDAFYDIESIRAGQFETIILKQIGRPSVFPAAPDSRLAGTVPRPC